MFDTASTTELFLRIFGLYFVAAGAGTVINPGSMNTIRTEMENSAMLRFITGFLAFVTGVIVLAIHQPAQGWTSTLVTAFGWLSLLKGVVLFVLPSISLGLMKAVASNTNVMRIYALVIVIVGAGLLYLGFA
ncbi:hypothetical protein [Hyphobacterium sp.]|uniref:hypothetical protein n=1 Tax=Hyphobacterium sp. TaxID=2004662 RepID=UPI003BA96D3C